jgi:hypothetical protein
MTDSADKRSVATDALATLGTILDDKQKRDAIHLAVEPVVAGEFMGPGEHITVENGVARRVNPGKGLGIVDPFLLAGVEKGQHFWFIMYPRKISSLRHVWAHPSFPDEPEIERTKPNIQGGTWFPEGASRDEAAASLAWIKEYAESIHVDVNELMDGAKAYLDHGEYFMPRDDMGRLEGVDTDPAFWEHYTNVTGLTSPEEGHESFFSCSC